MKRTILTLFALSCFAFAALAADATGKWTSQAEGRNGNTRTTTFNFTVSGKTLTGNLVTAQGNEPISEGKVDGDTISFLVARTNKGLESKVQYTGQVKGNTIEFTRVGRGGRGRTATFTATKAN